MSNPTNSLLPILNQTALQKTDPKLYQVLQQLIGNLHATEQSITTVVTGTAGSGFVTSTIGGTPTTIAMFTASRNIEDVTSAAVSAALDLL